MELKLYTIVAKVLKHQKVRRFQGLIPIILKVTGGKAEKLLLTVVTLRAETSKSRNFRVSKKTRNFWQKNLHLAVFGTNLRKNLFVKSRLRSYRNQKRYKIKFNIRKFNLLHLPIQSRCRRHFLESCFDITLRVLQLWHQKLLRVG